MHSERNSRFARQLTSRDALRGAYQLPISACLQFRESKAIRHAATIQKVYERRWIERDEMKSDRVGVDQVVTRYKRR